MKLMLSTVFGMFCGMALSGIGLSLGGWPGWIVGMLLACCCSVMFSLFILQL